MDRWEIDSHYRKARGQGGSLHIVRRGRGRPRSMADNRDQRSRSESPVDPFSFRKRSASSSGSSKFGDSKSDANDSDNKGKGVSALKVILQILIKNFNKLQPDSGLFTATGLEKTESSMNQLALDDSDNDSSEDENKVTVIPQHYKAADNKAPFDFESCFRSGRGRRGGSIVRLKIRKALTIFY
jgi:hypothetical protein